MSTHEQQWTLMSLGPWSDEHSLELKSSLEHGPMMPWALISTHERFWCHSTILVINPIQGRGGISKLKRKYAPHFSNAYTTGTECLIQGGIFFLSSCQPVSQSDFLWYLCDIQPILPLRMSNLGWMLDILDYRTLNLVYTQYPSSCLMI